MKVRIDYASKSVKYPRFSKELDFTDEKHLQNYLDKANREGKKIIGHEIISNPCVYFVHISKAKDGEPPSLNYAKEFGVKYTIKEFQNAFNGLKTGIEQDNGFIIFDNIK